MQFKVSIVHKLKKKTKMNLEFKYFKYNSFAKY